VTRPPTDAIQRRTLGTLVSTQVLGGVGLSAGVAVGALLAEEVSGSTALAGLGGTFQVLGTALITIPMTRLIAARGRRPGLALGYALAAVGGIGLIVAGVTSNFALLLVSSLLFGGATTSNGQARYAAIDLAPPDRLARQLSLVVWVTTVGSVLGPNLVGPSEPVARWLGLPVLTGPYVFSVVGLVLATIVMLTRLRPDPLLEARRRLGESPADRPHASMVRGLRAIVARRRTAVALLTLAFGHAVMVSVMVMTPLHMNHGGAGLTVIGFVISLHITGMFAFSPVMGWAVDRWGSRVVAIVGALILASATLLASASSPGSSTVLTVALFLLGLGWSASYVSASSALSAGLTPHDRPAGQGGADLVMSLTAAAAGALAGVVVDVAGFDRLAWSALALALIIGVANVLTPSRSPVDEEESVAHG
jgi:MFS family permease